MEETCLFSLPEGIVVEQIQITEQGLHIEAAATAPMAPCPVCSEESSSIHCHYRRTLPDVPCAGRRVQLLLTVRKFSRTSTPSVRGKSSLSVFQPLSNHGPG